MITLVIVVLSALALDGTHGESVFQSERLVTVRVGQPVVLPCRYESAFSDAANTLFWYNQGSPGGLQHLLSSYDILNAETRKERKGFSAEKKAKSYNLTKDAAELSDSAVYFCALRGSGKPVFGSGTRLLVTSNLEDSSPSVYQLMPKHKETTDGPDAQERTAACLFTDYSPNPLKVGINEESMEKINGSVVVVTEDDDDQKGTPSYGIVLWGNNENLDCTAHDKDNNVFRTNPEDPGICSEDDGTTTFETDERLNLLSLSVLGLRIIFFKAIAFNVLLTFHVYSRRVRK